MTVPHEDPDKLAAKLLAGELSPEETAALRAEIEVDPEARDALARMEEAVQVLRTWRQTFDALPPPVVPQLPRRRWLRFWSAAAAVLLVAGLVAWAVLLRSRPSSTPPPDWAQDELLSLVTAPPGPAATGDPHLWLGAPGDGPGFGGPPPGGADTGPPPEVVRLFDQFRRQFDFAFRLPARLPGEYELERARPLSPSAVQLFYAAGDRRLQLYLKASPGPDESARLWEPAGQPGRRLWTARRGGIAFALEGKVDQSRF